MLLNIPKVRNLVRFQILEVTLELKYLLLMIGQVIHLSMMFL